MVGSSYFGELDYSATALDSGGVMNSSGSWRGQRLIASATATIATVKQWIDQMTKAAYLPVKRR